MPSRAVAHAWTVVADKLVLDSQTNNFVICAVERLKFSLSPLPEGVKGVLARGPIEVLSLWYRVDKDKPGRAEARVRLLGQADEELALSTQMIDLTTAARMRVRATFRSLPISGDGILHFVTELKASDEWKEVGRVPLEVKVEWSNEQPGPEKANETERGPTDRGPAGAAGKGGRALRKQRQK